MAADCRARCIDGADLGSPVPGTDHMIANADPRCPVHGDPDAVQDYIAAAERVAEKWAALVALNPGARTLGGPASAELWAALDELKELD